MLKLLKNELIKIFKRKSIYILFILSLIIMAIYIKINPDQNIITSSTYSARLFYNISAAEEQLKNVQNDVLRYIDIKTGIDWAKFYESYPEDSWQRFALKEETNIHFFEGVHSDYNRDIDILIEDMNNFELNPNTEITSEQYEKIKMKFDEYKKALNSGDWKKFVELKIKNLEERKNTTNLLEEIEEINFEIELYKVRLENNINFNNDIQNHYIESYKEANYTIKSYKIGGIFSKAFNNKAINRNNEKMALCKYALENNIKQDISALTNIIIDNKIDSRIYFIRTFEHFDIIVAIITIYISTTILTEEAKKGTVKSLLIKPHKRSTILISKIIAAFFVVVVSMIFIVISQYIIGGIVFGFENYKLGYIGYDFNNNTIVEMNLFTYIILIIISKLPMYITILLCCILMGVITQNSSITITITLLTFIGIKKFLNSWSRVETNYIVSKYFITNNWDFSIYLFGNISNVEGVTLSSSIICYTIYMIILLLLTIYKFNKKEINNV